MHEERVAPPPGHHQKPGFLFGAQKHEQTWIEWTDGRFAFTDRTSFWNSRDTTANTGLESGGPGQAQGLLFRDILGALPFTKFATRKLLASRSFLFFPFTPQRASLEGSGEDAGMDIPPRSALRAGLEAVSWWTRAEFT